MPSYTFCFGFMLFLAPFWCWQPRIFHLLTAVSYVAAGVLLLLTFLPLQASSLPLLVSLQLLVPLLLLSLLLLVLSLFSALDIVVLFSVAGAHAAVGDLCCWYPFSWLRSYCFWSPGVAGPLLSVYHRGR